MPSMETKLVFLKPRVFWFHYNKVLSRKRGIPTVTVHFYKQCFHADSLRVNVPVFSKTRMRQPFFIMTGKARSLHVHNANTEIVLS